MLDLHNQIKLAMIQGDAEHQYLLGYRYYLGEEVVQDFKSAVILFTQAGEQEFVRAQFHLGLMYYEGHGVDQDFYKARYWFRKAADNGNIWGKFYIALMNRDPKIPSRDIKRIDIFEQKNL